MSKETHSKVLNLLKSILNNTDELQGILIDESDVEFISGMIASIAILTYEAKNVVFDSFVEEMKVPQ